MRFLTENRVYEEINSVCLCLTTVTAGIESSGETGRSFRQRSLWLFKLSHWELSWVISSPSTLIIIRDNLVVV